MQEVTKWLKSYGLNDTEVKVYLCIIQHPGLKVSEIQLHTGLVRTTIYNSLSQLKSDGLISESQQNNVKTYRESETDALRQRIKSTINSEEIKLEKLALIEPLLSSLRDKESVKSSYVSRYEGTGPVKQAIEKAFRCDSKKWHIIASRNNFLFHTSNQYKQYYLNERKKRKIISKTLWEDTDDFKEPSLEDIFYRNPRKLPKEFSGTFNSLIILYDDTTLIIDSYDLKTAHAIHNPTSTHLLRLMHENIWGNAAKAK